MYLHCKTTIRILASRVTRIEKVSIFGLLLKAQVNFLGEIISPQSGDIFGYFCLYLICLHFHQNKQFQSTVFRRYFKSSEGVCVDVLYFHIDEGIFAFFGLATVLATFPPNLGLFFTNHLITLLALNLDEDILAFFGLETVLATFSPQFGLIFCKSSGHPVSLDKRLKLIAQNCKLRSKKFYSSET